MSERANEQHDIGTKVHGDKLGHATAAGRTAAAPDAAAFPADPGAINPDHPDAASERGTGGLMPGSYEQAGGEAGHAAGQGDDATEGVRAAGSKVPDPAAEPRLRDEALEIAAGTRRFEAKPGEGPR